MNLLIVIKWFRMSLNLINDIIMVLLWYYYDIIMTNFVNSSLLFKFKEKTFLNDNFK
jgi:hypothetical protein